MTTTSEQAVCGNCGHAENYHDLEPTGCMMLTDFMDNLYCDCQSFLPTQEGDASPATVEGVKLPVRYDENDEIVHD